jgi:hypothetical protein
MLVMGKYEKQEIYREMTAQFGDNFTSQRKIYKWKLGERRR